MKVINFGSLNIDKVYQLVDFVSAGETVSAADYQEHAGGKGLNQSIALARAGAQVMHVGAIGRDGAFLKALLAEEGVDVSMVKTIDEATGHAIIQVNAKGQNCIIVYGGANHRLTRGHIDEALAQGAPGDLVLLQNEVNDVGYIIAAAHALGLKVACNPSPITENIAALPLHDVDIFLVNEIEGAYLADLSQNATGTAETTNYEEILQMLHDKYPQSCIVLTLGGEGVLYQSGQDTLCVKAIPVMPVDTTAAGDTFTGYYLEAILHGCGAEAALQRANRAAAIAVTRPGAAQSIPRADEV